MLLRRNVNAVNKDGGGGVGRSGSGNNSSYDNRFSRFASSPPPKRTVSNSSGTSPRNDDTRDRERGLCSSLSTWVLLLLAAILTALTYVFPNNNNSHQGGGSGVASGGSGSAGLIIAHKAYEAEQELEKEMFDWWQKEGHPGQPLAPKASVDGVELNDATMRMLQQPSKWVDGEKKLKSQLKLLAERQRQGKDIGVPVLTRYLQDDSGNDIPAFVSDKSQEVEAWKKLVADKYVEMRKAEDEWEKEVTAKLEQNKHRG